MSELIDLLKKNACGEGLDEDEIQRAHELIAHPTYEGTCWLCKDPAIYDTNLCQGHAFYALVTRK